MSTAIVAIVSLLLLVALWLLAPIFSSKGERVAAEPRGSTATIVPPEAPTSGVRRQHLSRRVIVLETFVRFNDRRVPVPELAEALICPRDDVVRTAVHARAAIADLFQDGLLDLELIPREQALASGKALALYLSGPHGYVFGVAKLLMSLEDARAELAASQLKEGAAS